METKEVKPCPFCGGAADYDENYHRMGWGAAYCTVCSADMPHGRYEGQAEAIARWNRRGHQPTTALELIAEVERLSAALKARIEEGKDNT